MAENKANGEGGDRQGGGTTPKAKEVKVASQTPENTEGAVNPSAPGETGTTPGSNAK